MQRLIGLLGGTSWPSTIEYYRTLNQMVQVQLGGFHSANVLLRSIDYHAIKSRYHEGWDEIPELLAGELVDFSRRGPDCILICNNTLHKAYDLVRGDLELDAPVIHIVDAVAKEAVSRSFKNLLLLGTKFTMEDGFYATRLEEFGLTVTTPSLIERNQIQQIQSQLAMGEMDPEYRTFFKSLLAQYEHVDAAILGCTELPLAIGASEASQALLNPIELQCAEAVQFALGKASE